jgi:hypothetical protein
LSEDDEIPAEYQADRENNELSNYYPQLAEPPAKQKKMQKSTALSQQASEKHSVTQHRPTTRS